MYTIMKNTKNKEYVKDDLALIDSLKEENTLIMKQIEEGQKSLEEGQKSLEEGQKSLEEGQKSLEEGQKSLEEGQKSLEERNRAFEEDKKSFEEQILVTAQKLLNKDFSIEEVKDITGLSLEVLHSLK